MVLRLNLDARFVKKIALVFIVAGLTVAAVVVGNKIIVNKNPLPANIKQQLSFPVIYPIGSLRSKVDQSSINYQPEQKSLSLTIQNNGTSIILSEQAAPGDSSSPDITYYQSLGLTPATQFQTKLGLVVLVNFYTTGSFSPVGQNAVLADGGTLLIAHPGSNMSVAKWKIFFNSVSLYK